MLAPFRPGEPVAYTLDPSHRSRNWGTLKHAGAMLPLKKALLTILRRKTRAGCVSTIETQRCGKYPAILRAEMQRVPLSAVWVCGVSLLAIRHHASRHPRGDGGPAQPGPSAHGLRVRKSGAVWAGTAAHAVQANRTACGKTMHSIFGMLIPTTKFWYWRLSNKKVKYVGDYDKATRTKRDGRGVCIWPDPSIGGGGK